MAVTTSVALLDLKSKAVYISFMKTKGVHITKVLQQLPVCLTVPQPWICISSCLLDFGKIKPPEKTRIFEARINLMILCFLLGTDLNYSSTPDFFSIFEKKILKYCNFCHNI